MRTVRFCSAVYMFVYFGSHHCALAKSHPSLLFSITNIHNILSKLLPDTSLVEKVREQIPVSKQRRLDLYDTISKFNAQD